MSAYMIDRNHVQFLVAAFRHYKLRVVVGAEEHPNLGQMLWDWNMKSVKTRYPDCEGNDLPGPIGETFQFQDVRSKAYDFEPQQVIRAIDCLEYQSCEFEGWNETPAYRLLQELRDAAYRDALKRLPEAETVWGAPEPRGVLLSELCR